MSEAKMVEFTSHRDFRLFAGSVQRERRYLRSDEQELFLEAVLATSEKRQAVLEAGSPLWRAQRGHDWRAEDIGNGVIEQLPAPFSPERMRPLADRAREGRANPKGIPYLYVATHQPTAVAEVRPWIGTQVSIAKLVLLRDVRLINCTTDDHRIMWYSSEPELEERERAVWQDIDRAFSRPVTSEEDSAHYAVTQVIAEWFRHHGLDGIAYGSSLGQGHNIALFDLEAAELRSCDLVEIRAISLDFQSVTNPYFTVPQAGDTTGV